MQSFFLSPSKPTKGGWILGAGPALLLPTDTDGLLGAKKRGAGPTAVVLRQDNGWTYGALANQIWSFAGASSREQVSATFVQPFLSFTTKSATTFTLYFRVHLRLEAQTVDGEIVMVQQLVKIAKQPVA